MRSSLKRLQESRARQAHDEVHDEPHDEARDEAYDEEPEVYSN